VRGELSEGKRDWWALGVRVTVEPAEGQHGGCAREWTVWCVGEGEKSDV
jgi:hypothetical protein